LKEGRKERREGSVVVARKDELESDFETRQEPEKRVTVVGSRIIF